MLGGPVVACRYDAYENIQCPPSLCRQRYCLWCRIQICSFCSQLVALILHVCSAHIDAKPRQRVYSARFSAILLLKRVHRAGWQQASHHFNSGARGHPSLTFGFGLDLAVHRFRSAMWYVSVTHSAAPSPPNQFPASLGIVKCVSAIVVSDVLCHFAVCMSPPGLHSGK